MPLYLQLWNVCFFYLFNWVISPLTYTSLKCTAWWTLKCLHPCHCHPDWYIYNISSIPEDSFIYFSSQYLYPRGSTVLTSVTWFWSIYKWRYIYSLYIYFLVSYSFCLTFCLQVSMKLLHVTAYFLTFKYIHFNRSSEFCPQKEGSPHLSAVFIFSGLNFYRFVVFLWGYLLLYIWLIVCLMSNYIQ